MPERPAPWTRPDPLPAPVETERLILRWWREDDATRLYEAVTSDRASLLPWLPWGASGHQDVAESLRTIEMFTRLRASDETPDFTVGAFDKVTGEAVGGAGFHRLVPASLEAETGYWIRGDRQRQGLCTEMTRAWITAGFRDWGFRRIFLVCAGGNLASQRVVEKLGIPLEGRTRQDRWIDGHGFDDSLTYGVMRDEWPPTP